MSKRKKINIENLVIEKYAAEGKCIGKHQDKIIFVEGVVPGDIADVYVTKNKKDWAEASVKQITQKSASRIDPFCDHFGICGGCKWQMLPYELQIEYKEQQVKDQLRRIGRVEVEAYLPIKGCAETRFYRNKLEFTFSNKQYLTHEDLNNGIPFEKNVLGFHAPRLFDKVIDITTCHLQQDPSNAIKNFIRELAARKQFTYYDIKNHSGLLRTLIIRVSADGQVLVNLVFGENNTAAISYILHNIQVAFPHITSLYYTINEKFNDSIYDVEMIHVAGAEFIEEKLNEFVFRISPKSFFQTNPKQTIHLYNIVRDFADCTGKEVLYDLYCGTGSIGIYLSKNVKKIVGVETVADAIADAKINAEVNKLSNVSFHVGDVIKICNNDFFSANGHPDIVVIDPPRAGCHQTLIEKLLEIEAEKIVYVSCNPATQARDLLLLSAKYDIKKSQAVDMFPHTHHVENVVLLHIKK